MKTTLLLTSLSLLSTAFLFSSAAARSRAADDEQEAREAAFAELLTGARLTGFFTDDAAPDGPLQKDSYTIAKAEALEDDVWRIESLIEYGENKVSVPLFVKVKWAGDTPVITLDQVKVPGLGTFDARVLFHDGSYAGLWRGAKHGGQMIGRVERALASAQEK